MAKRFFVNFLAMCGLTILLPEPAFAEKRAFVVGTNSYTNVAVLKKAIPDAEAMTKVFGELGFKVSSHQDLTLSGFNEKWGAFLSDVQPGDVVAFYFAGHGVQVDTLNYLLPKSVPGADAGQAALLEKSINFHELMEKLQARQPGAAIYILDACRSDPFKGAKKAKGTLGQSKGLSRIENVYNAFVMYSAGPDEVAYDISPLAQDRANSVYINQLLPVLGKLDASLVDVAKQVQVSVYGETKAFPDGYTQQRPAYFDGILGQYFLSQANPNAPLGTATESIVNDNVIRLGGFATWDANCQSRPAPRVAVNSQPKNGRVIIRFEAFEVAAKHFGNGCEKSKQRGVGVYYIVDEANRESTAVDRVKFSVKHWSVAPATSIDETFEIDLATRFSKRTTAQ